jgi:RNA polymerase sigma-70 factor (ECF subfamily)
MTELSPDDARDATLVARAVGGDRHAYADLVRRHQARALRLATVICGSTQEAEDAVQDAFVKAHGALSRVRPDEPVRPWLMRIVANTARNRRRSAGRRLRAHGRLQAQAAHVVPSTEAEALAGLRDDELWAALARVDSRDRAVLGLRFFAELTEAETASALGVARGTVKSRTSRALERLRAELGTVRT